MSGSDRPRRFGHMKGRLCTVGHARENVPHPRATQLGLSQTLPGDRSQQGGAAGSQQGGASESPMRRRHLSGLGKVG